GGGQADRQARSSRLPLNIGRRGWGGAPCPISPAGLQVPREPVAEAVPRVDLVLALRPAVALARVDHELRLAPRLDQGVVELERLRQRGAEVVLAVEDQRRRPALVGVVDRRAPRVLALRVVRLGLEEE